MHFEWMKLIIMISAIVPLLIAIKVLWQADWIKGWLRGTAGLSLVCLSLLIASLTVNLYHYRIQNGNEAIMTISFKQIEPHHYTAMITDVLGVSRAADVQGDFWQLSIRYLQWNDLLASDAGYYQLEKVNARYLTLEMERNITREDDFLSESDVFFDLWNTVHASQSWFGLMTADRKKSGFIPVTDGAIYEAYILDGALKVNSVNGVAERSYKKWR